MNILPENIYIEYDDNANIIKLGDIEVGQEVICLAGFNKKETFYDEFGAGAGYESGKIFKIGEITFVDNDTRAILWPDDDSDGIYYHACVSVKYYKQYTLPKLASKIENQINFIQKYTDYEY